MTIDQSVDVLNLALLAGSIFLLWLGWWRIRAAGRLPFFMLRRRRIAQGWRILLLAVGLVLCSIIMRFYGRPAAYVLIQPTASATPTFTPSATFTPSLTPSITPTPQDTATPSITPTPSNSPTPEIPEAIAVLFRESITPRPEAVFSAIQVARRLDSLNRAINASQSFELPIETLYGAFTYDFLQDGVRWTALWYQADRLVCSETKPWDGGTGGYGFTECNPGIGWQSGEYEIRIFLGEVWQVSTRFTVEPERPTASPTATGNALATQTPGS